MIGERIKLVRKAHKMTQQDFATRINISRSNIASIEVGRINVTDRVLFDICNNFDVDELWLRTGQGSMEVQKDDDDVLVEWVAELTNKGCKNEFAKRFANMMAKLDEQEWILLQKMAAKLTKLTKQDQ